MISDEILSKYYSYVDVSLNAKNYGNLMSQAERVKINQLMGHQQWSLIE